MPENDVVSSAYEGEEGFVEHLNFRLGSDRQHVSQDFQAQIFFIAQSKYVSLEKILFADPKLPEPPQTVTAVSTYLENIQSRKVIPAA